MSGLSASEAAVELSIYKAEQTVGAALASMARAFADGGIESGPRDARLLLQGLLGIDGAAMLSRPDRPLGEAAERVGDAVRRRLAHEPVSRILGVRQFYGRDFIVTPDVLDPRPDTEAVIELALEIVKSSGLTDHSITVADIGTGSGILIATLLAELRHARGIATDISSRALAIARRNAEKLGVGNRVKFLATSGLDDCDGPFDLVVSNPPYIRSDEIAGLERAVADYDPRIALDGGPDGLAIYREIAALSVKLQPSARLVVEVGADQADDVEALFKTAGWRPLGRKKDLGGQVRAVAVEIHR